MSYVDELVVFGVVNRTVAKLLVAPVLLCEISVNPLFDSELETIVLAVLLVPTISQ